jgi:hypothetical protein
MIADRDVDMITAGISRVNALIVGCIVIAAMDVTALVAFDIFNIGVSRYA